jgi:tRNA-splicing endonuclease subunit Sen15, fungi type
VSCVCEDSSHKWSARVALLGDTEKMSASKSVPIPRAATPNELTLGAFFSPFSSVTIVMDAHPSSAVLAPLLQKYPRVAGSLFQTYNDLVHAQQWTAVETIDLAPCSRGALKGYRPNAANDDLLFVVPCSLAETLSAAWIRAAFSGLGSPELLYLAIASEDSSVVYYKISQGIVKPPL